VNRLYGLEDSTPIIYNNMNFNTKRAMNLQDPQDDQDAVTLGYLRRWLSEYTATGKIPGDRI
jgi:hypothetical protein